ncbi:unnamed protein product [Hermetia illucens]|uniref:Uncharacterized protein n=1 Tax=Hermetia illucens TaxID=343691 RepID=A0A7R8Z1Y7_HERIL|nr:unnamed protein product [Hermetia illucens]
MQSPTIVFGFLVSFVVLSVSSEEFYSNHDRNMKYLTSELESLKRQSRFIKFNTLDDDLRVELEFLVPFLKIPVKRTMNDASSIAKGFMNINVAALVLTGIMVIAGVSTASALSHLARAVSGRSKTQRSFDVLEDITSFPFMYRNSKNEKEEAPFRDIFSNIDTIFQEYGIDLPSCFQKTACLLVEESTKSVVQGKGTGFNKIVDGLTSIHWVLGFISGTAIGEAVDIARSYHGCTSRHTSCSWSDNSIMDFISSI